MNNSENIPNAPAPLDEGIAATPAANAAATTVFSDGSTFDYENGYQNNGAPVATRDRTEHPTIVKSHKILTGDRIFIVFGSLMALFLIAGFIAFGVYSFQKMDNKNALKAGVEESGQVKIVQSAEDTFLLKRPDGSFFKCAVSYVSNNDGPLGLVFCTPGGPATFTIPVPHDPVNVFYVAPVKDK